MNCTGNAHSRIRGTSTQFAVQMRRWYINGQQTTFQFVSANKVCSSAQRYNTQKTSVGNYPGIQNGLLTIPLREARTVSDDAY